jgi:hypothetical protein
VGEKSPSIKKKEGGAIATANGKYQVLFKAARQPMEALKGSKAEKEDELAKEHRKMANEIEKIKAMWKESEKVNRIPSFEMPPDQDPFPWVQEPNYYDYEHFELFSPQAYVWPPQPNSDELLIDQDPSLLPQCLTYNDYYGYEEALFPPEFHDGQTDNAEHEPYFSEPESEDQMALLEESMITMGITEEAEVEPYFPSPEWEEQIDLMEEPIFYMPESEEEMAQSPMGMPNEIYWDFPYPQSFQVTHDGDEPNPYFIGIDPIGWTDESGEEIPLDF